MPKIETVYFINHNHADLGYTDHPDVVLRQHMRFIDDAIELCEATAGDPTDTEFKWTCESSGIAGRRSPNIQACRGWPWLDRPYSKPPA